MKEIKMKETRRKLENEKERKENRKKMYES